jgi:ATP-dependent RNA helicase CshB
MSFKSFNLSEKMVGSLERQGYLSPSSIQERVIPKALRGNNIVAQSETGSGKTHAFLIPIIEKLHLEENVLQALIITPTRELAKQIHNFILSFKDEFSQLHSRLFIGGEELDKTFHKGMKVPHIIVGTPTRVHDFLDDSTILDLSKVRTLVLDEADMVMEMGYFHDVDAIFKALHSSPQVMVFSATLEFNLRKKLEKYVGSDFTIEMDDVKTAKAVTHHLIDIKHGDRLFAIQTFIEVYNPYLLIIFASRKEDVIKIGAFLTGLDHDIISIHGDMSIRERRSSFKRIATNKVRIIVASDLASRGLDIKDISDVLNYDLPRDLTYYFHRAGRTGRFGVSGRCFTFYNVDSLKSVEQLIKQGVAFSFLELKDGIIGETKAIAQRKVFRKKRDLELEREIKVAKAKTQTNIVKPGYKKKVRLAVKKVQTKHRREIIRKDIRRQRVERYKKEGGSRE